MLPFPSEADEADEDMDDEWEGHRHALYDELACSVSFSLTSFDEFIL